MTALLCKHNQQLCFLKSDDKLSPKVCFTQNAHLQLLCVQTQPTTFFRIIGKEVRFFNSLGSCIILLLLLSVLSQF